MFLKKFLTIGFKFHSYDELPAGKVYEYKYYPDYMDDKHYTLVVFEHYQCSNKDWRLYIHNNSDGSFLDSPFQINDHSEWNRNYINNMIDEIFKSEIRDMKLKELGI